MSEPLRPDYDPDSLAESYPDPAAVQARLERLRADVRGAPDEIGELLARFELVDLLRGGGSLDDALNEARAAVDRAELVGSGVQKHLARVRLARVHQRRGEFAESNLLFVELNAEKANYGAVIMAYTNHAAGENEYAQGLWGDARLSFGFALAAREVLELPDEELLDSRIAWAAADRRRRETTS